MDNEKSSKINNEIEKKLMNICKLFMDNCYKVEKNEDSSDGNVYVLYCEKNKYIAKIYNDILHAQAMINLHQNLDNAGISVPRVIYTDCNEIDNNSCEYIVIYSFINGKQISDMLHNGKVEDNLIIPIAKKVRKMHDTFVNENQFGLPELSFDTYNNRKTVLHFDLTKSNIFSDENANIAIIDFDDARYGSAIYDISILHLRHRFL